MLHTTMRMPLLNSTCGKRDKRGFIFILDSLIAVIILFIVIGASSYISKSSSELSKLQISRTGSDITALLENKGVFDSLDYSEINESLAGILPLTYSLRMNVTCSDDELSEYSSIIVGDDVPEKKFIASGRRFFVATKNGSADFCMVQYYTWQK